MNEFVEVRIEQAVATVQLSRPPSNTLTRQTYRELAAVAAQLSADPAVRVVLLFGGHEIFSAGDDSAELATLTPPEAETFAVARRNGLEAIAAIRQPTVAAVTGYALGSGLGLALAADWRVSGDNVKFGATEVSAGLIPDSGTLGRLAATVGAGSAKEMVFSGRFVDAEEALALGVIDEMVAPDGVYDAALAYARRFLDSPPHAVAAAKAAINEIGTSTAADREIADRRRYVAAFAAAFGADRH